MGRVVDRVMAAESHQGMSSVLRICADAIKAGPPKSSPTVTAAFDKVARVTTGEPADCTWFAA